MASSFWLRYWIVAIARKSESAAAPKIGGVEPTPATSILSAPAASTSGGPKANVENEILYGRSFSWPDLLEDRADAVLLDADAQLHPLGRVRGLGDREVGLLLVAAAGDGQGEEDGERWRMSFHVGLSGSAVVVDAEPLEQLAPAGRRGRGGRGGAGARASKRSS